MSTQSKGKGDLEMEAKILENDKHPY